MRVWRRDWRVFHKVIDAREAAALTVLLDGGTFAQMCAAAENIGPIEPMSPMLLSMLQTWLAEQVLAAADLSPDPLP
jgi:hypothetical protein